MFNTSLYYNYGLSTNKPWTLKLILPIVYTLQFDFSGVSPLFTIDWGDGTYESISSAGVASHEYSPGTYYMSISGSFASGGLIYPAKFTSDYIYETTRMRGVSGLASMKDTFARTKITTVPSDLFADHPDVTSFQNTFSDSLLTAIPSGLFDNNVNAESFSSTFSGCSSITSIPTSLFVNNVQATNFDGCFAETGISTIPANLFDHNTDVVSFYGTFAYCNLLESIPTGLFDNNIAVNDFDTTFTDCVSLESIPAGLFDNNVNVESFSETFYTCESLTSIPAGLFDNNTAVTDFSYTFSECISLESIPASLFDNNGLVTDFSYTFSNTAITSIPAGLFDNNGDVITFSGTFANTDITSIPDGLFSTPGLCQNFSYTFQGCQLLTTISAYLFAGSYQATTFESTFGNCINLQQNSSIFCFDGEESTRFFNRTVNFDYCFELIDAFSGAIGIAPELWNYDFGTSIPSTAGCWSGHSVSSVSNYDDIPFEWL